MLTHLSLSPLSKKKAAGEGKPTHEHLHTKAREFKPHMDKRSARPSVPNQLLADAQFILSF
jgi:hypothetical protein